MIMVVTEQLRLAWEALRANKLRSCLTALGVIIGVSAVIGMVSIGAGAQALVTNQIASLGTNLLTVTATPPLVNGVRLSSNGFTRLTLDDADAIAQSAPAARAVAPEMYGFFQVVAGRQNSNVQIVGTTPDYAEVRKLHLASGRFLLPADIDDAAAVCVLGNGLAYDLFSGGDPLGQTVVLAQPTAPGRPPSAIQLPLTVVGVIAPRGAGEAINRDNTLFVPTTTAQFRLIGNSYASVIDVEAASTAAMPEATAQVERILEQRHRIADPALDDFRVQSQQDMLQASQDVNRSLTLLLGGIGGISLLVGGIGIMNIMLVSVTERTKEIGIRKAIGAPPGAILAQFLVEAVVLSLAGGVIGIAIGFGVARAISRVAGWPALVPPLAVVVAFAFAAAIGLFFGIYPARRAARLDPIVALRHE